MREISPVNLVKSRILKRFPIPAFCYLDDAFINDHEYERSHNPSQFLRLVVLPKPGFIVFVGSDCL